jgi:microcin C transport system ATP-binding protein
VFERPQHPYTRHLMSAEPKGKPPRSVAHAPVVLETENLKVWFPIKRGSCGRTVDHVKAVDGLSLKLRAGETLGVVGESGSGKTTLGLALLRLVSSTGRSPTSASASTAATRARCARCARRCRSSSRTPTARSSPRLSVGQIIEEAYASRSPAWARTSGGRASAPR